MLICPSCTAKLRSAARAATIDALIAMTNFYTFIILVVNAHNNDGEAMLQILGMGAHLTRAHLHPTAGNHQLGLQWMATLDLHR